MKTEFTSFLSLLGPPLFALYVAIALKRHSFANVRRSNWIADFLELVPSMLLPVVVLGAVRKTQITSSLWISFVIGFCLPIVVYLVVKVLAGLTPFKSVFSIDGKINRLLLASFGGGNRGNLLILVAFGTQLPVGPEIIKHFVVVDLGNLICLISIGYWMVDRLATKTASMEFSEVVRRFAYNSGTWAAALIAVQLPWFENTAVSRILALVDPLLESTIPWIHAIFVFCIFLSIFIRIEKLSKVLAGTSNVLLSFLLSRAAASAAVALVLTLLGLSIYLIVAVVILAWMPPSSFLWIKVSSVVPRIPVRSKRETVYLNPNFVYFGLLGIALLWRLIATLNV